MTPSKRKIILLAILLLLLFCTVLLFACKEDDFYKMYGTSNSVVTQDASLTEETPSADELTQGTDSLEKESEENDPDLEKEKETTETQGENADVTEKDKGSVTEKGEDGATGKENETDEGSHGTNEGNGNENSSDLSEENEQNDPLSDDENKQEQTDQTQSDPEQTSDDQIVEDKKEESSLTDKEEPDYDAIFDLSVSWGDCYLYKSFDAPSEVFSVSVNREFIGTATVNATGDVTFDCGFVESECELWGKWDQKGNITTYVFFQTLAALKEIEFSPALAQLDLSAAELERLRGVVPPEGPEQGEEQEQKDSQQQGDGQEETQDDPTPQQNDLSDEGQEEQGEQEVPWQQGEGLSDETQSGGSTENEQQNKPQSPEQNENGTEQGGEQDPINNEEQGQSDSEQQEQSGDQESPEVNETPVVEHGAVADLSALNGSKAYSILEGLYGVAEGILVNYMDEEGEDYSFTLKEMTNEDLLTLQERLSPYDTYPSDGNGELYKKQCVLGGQAFSVSVTVTQEQGGYCAAFKVVGVSLA